MDVKIKVYDDCKYVVGSKKVAEVIYRNINNYEVVTGNRRQPIGMKIQNYVSMGIMQ